MEDVREISGGEHKSFDCPNFVDPKDGVNDCCGRCKRARSDHTKTPEKSEQDDMKERQPDDRKKREQDDVEKRKRDDSKKCVEEDSKKYQQDTDVGRSSTCKLPGCNEHRYMYVAGDFCGTKHAKVYEELYGNGKSMASGSISAITFYDRGSPYYEFTNFYPASITLEDKSWPTSEHYFQAQKFVGTPYVEKIRKLSTPREAFQMTRDQTVSEWKRKDWEDVKDDIMLKALTCKFTQHTDLRKKLLKTSDKWLVEHTANDSYWADGGDGTGQNKLGQFLMQAVHCTVEDSIQAMANFLVSDNLEWCCVCYMMKPSSQFLKFSNCGHSFCKDCAKSAFEMGVMESRTDLQCLNCSVETLPIEVQSVISKELYEKYLEFSLRRFLAREPNVRSCPSPDCPYAYILENISGCEENHFVCENESCGREFCYQCKCSWHPDRTCQEARLEVALDMPDNTLPEDVLKNMNAKQCPVCHATIEKMADGSCNQVHCISCGQDFCWLCGKKISEMHYMSPTGCPLYGQQQWSGRKLWCCRIGLWVSAPLLILLIALIVFLVILIALPAGVGYKVYTSCCKSKKACRIWSTVTAVLITLLFSPIVSVIGALAVLPVGYIYVYCVIPVHLLWTNRH